MTDGGRRSGSWGRRILLVLGAIVLVLFVARTIWDYAEAGNLGLRQPYRHGGFDVTHRAGRLVMFPSFLMHEIFPYQGERPRIVVAFNCSVN